MTVTLLYPQSQKKSSVFGKKFDDSQKFGALPDPPVKFTQQEYCNPDNPEDGYMAVEYNGRLYVPYGTLKGMITPKNVKECIGYIFFRL